MIKRPSLAALALLLLTVGTARAHVRVQPPTITAPQRGSLAGDYASTAFGPGDLSRGGFQLPAAFDVPNDRGALLAQVFPVYAPDAGISEWGLGWQSAISIQRSRTSGDLDYATDDLSGALGRLVRGDDGAYYAHGLLSLVRVEMVGDELIAYQPDGTRMRFGGAARIAAARGTFAWYLTEVETITGERTRLEYLPGPRPYLTSVLYGGRGDDFQARVELGYELIPFAFQDYLSGRRVDLDRRVNRVTIKTRHRDTGVFAERWHFDVHYDDEGTGPAFYLAKTVKTFSSGAVEPAVVYTYKRARDHLATTAFRAVPGLDRTFQDLRDAGALQPERSSPVDVDGDGRLELEHHRNHARIALTDTGYAIVPLPAATGPVVLACRPRPSSFSQPRTLARLSAADAEPSVVVLAPSPTHTSTTFTACARTGEALASQVLDGDWQLGPTVRLTDLNRDQRPDLVRVSAGQLDIAPGAAGGLEFAPARTQALEPYFIPDAAWVHDFNGDGVADVIGRFSAGLVVWYGLGGLEFATEGKTFAIVNRDGLPEVDLSTVETTFVDANRDGLTDALFSTGRRISLYVNHGDELAELPVPALDGLNGQAISRPIPIDLRGTGNTEVTLTRAGTAYAVGLDAAGVGLMATADDGMGTVLAFDYERSPAVPGVRARPQVLARLTVVRTGDDPITYGYGYSLPRVHSVGGFFLGFGAVERVEPSSDSRSEFLHDDISVGLLLSTRQRDREVTAVDQITSRTYDDVTFRGIRWRRPRAEETGYGSADGTKLVERTVFASYEDEICPALVRRETERGTLTTETIRAHPALLAGHLHCLEEWVTEGGVHLDPQLDFREERYIERNERGQIELVQTVAPDGALTVDHAEYDAEHRLMALGAPGRGRSTFEYEPGTRLPYRIVGADGVVTAVAERDPLTDAIRALTEQRGATRYTRHFRFDGEERLAREWDDLGRGSDAKPERAYQYRYATASQPAAVRTTNLVEGSSRWEAVDLTSAAGEPLGTARRTPTGWAWEGVVTRSRNTRITSRWTKAASAAGVDPAALDLASLAEGRSLVGLARASALGIDTETTTKHHVDVEQRVTRSLALAGGRLVESALENGTFQTLRRLDAGRFMREYVDETGATYRYTHDVLGRLRAATFPDGTTHRVAFDAHGRTQRIVRDGVATVDVAYQPETGLLASKTYRSPAGLALRTVTWGYDAIGRKLTETHADPQTGVEKTFRFYYDGTGPAHPTADTSQQGFLSAVSGDGFIKRIRYRPDGLLSRREVELGAWRRIVTTTDYTDDGSTRSQETTVFDERGSAIVRSRRDNEYDDLARLSRVLQDGRELVRVEFDANSLPAKALFADGSSVTLTYDSLTRDRVGVESKTRAFTAAHGLRKDSRGHVETERFTVGAKALARQHVYSPQSFLKSSTDADHAYEYGFDPAGTATHVTKDGVKRSLVADANRLTFGDVTIELDGLGRTIARGDLRLTYGPDGQIATARRGGTEWQYVHDEAGQRLVKKTAGQPTAAYLDEGYLHASGLIEPVRFAGRFVGIVRGGAFQLLANDLRGTRLADLDGTPRVASPFGDRDVHPDLAAAIDFVERSYDADLGFVRMGVRDYDPAINRFTTPDPLFLEKPELCVTAPLNCNLYQYARNNALSYGDPSGQIIDTILDGVMLAHDVYQLARQPTMANAVNVGVGALSMVVPFLPNPRIVKFAGKNLLKIGEKIGEKVVKKGLREGAEHADDIAKGAKNVVEKASEIGGGKAAKTKAAKAGGGGGHGGSGSGGGGVPGGPSAKKIPWGSWDDYPKVTQNGQEYAQVGDRLYSRHAVDRMQPSGMKFSGQGTGSNGGMPQIRQAGGSYDYGRSVAPQYVEDAIASSKGMAQANGNISHLSGTLEVILNKAGNVVTLITH